jgi:UDP-N-acetylglucosamine:LPS N-acetylglucosamine transferase
MNPEIVVVSGSYGAGHDAAADALTEQLCAKGHVVRRLDIVEELPWRIGALLRWLYFLQLRLVPGSWGTTVSCFERDGWAFHLARTLLGRLGRRLTRKVTDAGLVLSTHMFASQALGEARRRGELDVPVVTYLTDASVQRMWVHEAVDLHLAIHALAAGQAQALGGTTAVVRPAVPTSTTPPAGWVPPWPVDRPAALVVGGSCGVGELGASALDILATGVMTPVVACGTNTRLREHLAAIPGVTALGWRDDLTALVAAAGCVVQNAGGMTSLESLAAGTPTFTYRAIPGHGTTNARALDAAGLVPWLADAEELEVALARVLVSPGTVALPADAPTVLDVLDRHLLTLPEPLLVAA